MDPKSVLKIVFFLNIANLFSQDFSRIIELRNNRHYGEDIKKLQYQLINYGFIEIGKADGYYGPLTEGAIKNIQYFSGFEQNGKVDRTAWDFLFNESNDNLLKNISIISKQYIEQFTKETSRRMGYSTNGGEVQKYSFENEIKQINLILAGEIAQTHFYFINKDHYFMIKKYYRYHSLGVDTPPLGAVETGGAGDLFPRIRKNFKEKSSIPRCSAAGIFYLPETKDEMAGYNEFYDYLYSDENLAKTVIEYETYLYDRPILI